MSIDKEKVKDIIDKFSDDKFSDAAEILKKEFGKTRNDFLNNELSLEQNDEEDEKKDKKENPFAKKDDKKDKKENPFAKKDDKKKKKGDKDNGDEENGNGNGNGDE